MKKIFKYINFREYLADFYQEKKETTRHFSYRYFDGVGMDTYIGKHGNKKTRYNFYGCIDEVRVYRTPMSADYIKLNYMNQKGADALVRFKWGAPRLFVEALMMLNWWDSGRRCGNISLFK